MTKDEKVFLTGLIKGIEGRFDGLEGRFDGLEGRFDGLEGRFDGLEGRFDGLEGRFDGLEQGMDGFEKRVNIRFEGLESKVEQNSRDIRVNSMEIELMRDDVAHIGERDSSYAALSAKVDAMYEIVRIDIPAIKRAVISHSERIRALEAKSA